MLKNHTVAIVFIIAVANPILTVSIYTGDVMNEEMETMKLTILIVAALLLLIQRSESAMTEKQVQAAVKLIRNTCKTKIKIGDDQIEDIRNGNWDDNDEKVKCYTHCVLGMMKMQKKNGAADLESGLKQLPQLPEARREPTEISLKKCENAGEGLTNKCDLSYSFLKCVYLDNPQNYFFP